MRWMTKVKQVKITKNYARITFEFTTGPFSGQTITKTYKEEVKDNAARTTDRT
jgi:hypothetical protein